MRTSPQPTPSSLPVIGLLVIVCVALAVCWLLRHFFSILAPVADKRTTPPPAVEASRLSAMSNIPPHSLAPRWMEAAAPAPPRAGTNALHSYRKAFALFDALSEEEKTMLRKPGEEVDAEEAAALFAKVQAIMELLRTAANEEYCDWETGPISFETPLTHITKAQDLGKLALWAAAYQFPNDPGSAIEVLQDRAQLGHHLSDTLIGVLVASAFEASAGKLLLQHAGAFDATAIGATFQFLNSSAIDRDLDRAFATEVEGFERMAAKLGGKDAGEAFQVMNLLGEGDNRGTEALVRDPARLAAEVAFVQKIEGEMAAAMRLPEAEFQHWRRGVERDLQAHPLARQLVPSFDAVQRKVQQLRVERTLLAAGLDILQNGPAQFSNLRDPATGRALLYVPTPTGFEMRSTYQVKGKPVVLSFPQRP